MMEKVVKQPKVSLDQWRSLQAVVDYAGYAQAAESLNRSQSSVSYAVNRLEQQLGIDVLVIKGRKAELTSAGKVLLERSRQLVADATALEQQAHYLEAGWEAEIKIAVEAAFPTDIIIQALKQFEQTGKQTRVRLEEVVLSGAEEALLNGSVDLAISPFIPPGFLGDEIIQVHFVAVAHPSHALHQLNRELTLHDLSRETHVILSDSGSKGVDSGWINHSKRWTVTSPDSAFKIISNGMGYGWLPEKVIQPQLENNELKILPLSQGQRNTAILYLVYKDLEQVGPATKCMATILQSLCIK